MERSIILLQQPGFSRSTTFHQRRSLHQEILSRLLVRAYVATSVFRYKAVPSFELYPLIVAAFLWGKEWSTSNIVVYCNNEATVHCINKHCSHSPAMMPLIRLLIWIAACNQFIITAKHVPGSKNQITDSFPFRNSGSWLQKRTPTRPHRDVLKLFHSHSTCP